MSGTLRYFWFGCAAFWLILIILKRKDLRALVDSGRISETEVLRFQMRLGAAIIAPCLLLGGIQIAGNFKSPFQIAAESPNNPWVLAAWMTIATSWLLLLYWLWLRNGAEYLAVFAEAFGLPENPTAIRLGLTFLVLVGAVTGLLLALGVVHLDVPFPMKFGG